MKNRVHAVFLFVLPWRMENGVGFAYLFVHVDGE